MLTRSIKKHEFKKKVYVVDATGVRMGKLVTKVASILLGKMNVKSARYLPFSDKVIIENIRSVDLAPSKWEKTYSWHSGFPGGYKELTIKKFLEKNPEKLFRRSVWGMLPKNRYGRALLKNLEIIDKPADLKSEVIKINI